MLGLGDFDDDFVGLSQAKFVAGDGFDFVGIGFEGLNFVGEFGVFFGEAVDVGLHAFDIQFGAAHGEVAVSAEDVMQEKSEDAQDENGPSVLGPDRGEFCLLGHATGI